MGLFGKMKLLVGALVHKPFAPKPEKVDLTVDSGSPLPETPRHEKGTQIERVPEIEDTGRVADLITQKKQDGTA